VSVKFHCSKCSKLIQAPREAAGQRGKCPYCQQSVYIPTPPEELEEIPLAPLEEEASGGEPLDDEAELLLSELGHAQDEPTESPSAGPRAAAARGAGAAADVQRAVIKVVLLMKESRLEEAEEMIRRLKGHAEEARARVQALLIDEIPPPELEDCPPALYKGFLRKIVESL
jgi:DNA-directed RNA polymerase subunit RPC12/RpoP